MKYYHLKLDSTNELADKLLRSLKDTEISELPDIKVEKVFQIKIVNGRMQKYEISPE